MPEFEDDTPIFYVTMKVVAAIRAANEHEAQYLLSHAIFDGAAQEPPMIGDKNVAISECVLIDSKRKEVTK